MKTNYIYKFYWLLSAVFLYIYFLIVYKNTDNIPRWDDFSTFFEFCANFINSSSVIEKLKIVSEFHIGMHRIALTELITLASYGITGKLNLVTFIIIGNIFLLGIGIMFFVFMKQKQHASIFVFLIVLLIYNGQNFETSTWAMVGLANVGTLLTTMLSIYFILKPTRIYFIIGLALSVITVFSNGCGMCLFPAILLSLFLQKKKNKFICFAIVVGFAVIAYFINWKHINSFSSFNAFDVLISFFNFLGGNFWLPSIKIISFVVGLFIFITWVWAFIGNFYKNNIEWFTFFTFMLLTALMVALNRPAAEMAPLRYRIYACMLIVSALMFYFENREVLHLTRWIQFIILPVALFSIFCSLLYLDKCEKISEYKKVTAYNWERNKSGLFPNDTNMEEILQRTEDMSIYTMPKLPLKELVSKTKTDELKWESSNSNILFDIDFLEETNEYLLIKGWAYTNEMSMDFTDIFLWIYNESKNIKVHPYFERRYDIKASDLTVLENCGFFAVIPKAELPHGIYKLGIEIQKKYIIPIKKSAKYMETERCIEI